MLVQLRVRPLPAIYVQGAPFQRLLDCTRCFLETGPMLQEYLRIVTASSVFCEIASDTSTRTFSQCRYVSPPRNANFSIVCLPKKVPLLQSNHVKQLGDRPGGSRNHAAHGADRT